MNQSISRIMNGKDFAAPLGVTPRSVSDWADEGMPCTLPERSGSPVSIHVRLAIKWLMRRRVEPAANQRIALAKAERLEMMNLEGARRGALAIGGQATGFERDQFSENHTGKRSCAMLVRRGAATSDQGRARPRMK